MVPYQNLTRKPELFRAPLGPGTMYPLNPLSQALRTCTPMTAYFHDKTKILNENLQMDYYLLLKYCRRQCALLLPSRAKSLARFITKM